MSKKTNPRKKQIYASPGVTVDMVIFAIEARHLKVLLIKRTNPPFKTSWALPGGFLLKKEQAHDAAKRILKDKAGVTNVYIEQLYTFDAPRRDPRGQILTVSYFALVPKDKLTMQRGKTLQTPSFFPVKTLPPLAFDHKEIIAYAVKRLRAKLEYTNAAFSLLPRYFTFSQLHYTYEIIMGRKIDKRNFKKKFFSLNLITPTKHVLRGIRHRPARLYTFRYRTPRELTKKFFS